MNSSPEPELHHLMLQKKLKDSLASNYLTVLSIIQGVALADLSMVVATGYLHFTVMHRLLVLLTFGVIILVWNQYSMLSTLWLWIPDFRDAAIPFVIGALDQHRLALLSFL